MDFRTTDFDKKQPLLHCPVCGVEYTHLESAEPYDGDEGRKAVILNFTCEEGHTFSFDLHNHKGYTMCRTEIKEPASLHQQ